MKAEVRTMSLPAKESQSLPINYQKLEERQGTGPCSQLSEKAMLADSSTLAF
jgi:hypothetical protein